MLLGTKDEDAETLRSSSSSGCSLERAACSFGERISMSPSSNWSPKRALHRCVSNDVESVGMNNSEAEGSNPDGRGTVVNDGVSSDSVSV